MASTKKVLDLDAELGLELDGPQHTRKIKMLGREWTIVCDVNSYALSEMLSGTDPGAVARFISGLLLEEEAAAFNAALGRVRNLDGEKLGELLNKLIEVAAERPTEPPSPSPRTATKPTSVRKSPAR